MIWAIDLDDFQGSCGGEPYPLLRKLRDVLTSGATPAPSTQAPVTAAPTTQAPVTAAPTTQAPITAAPSTQAPVTAAPTTQAPVTAAPTTQSPVTAAPSTVAPVTSSPSSDFKRVCYHTNWAQYRPVPGKFVPGDIDAKLCTHIMYSFGKVSSDDLKIYPYEWNDESTDWSKGTCNLEEFLIRQNLNIFIFEINHNDPCQCLHISAVPVPEGLIYFISVNASFTRNARSDYGHRAVQYSTLLRILLFFSKKSAELVG